MRNLKKILALVLALVMSLSLMATAGAASFPDVADDNAYKTAIEVLNGVEVLQGYDNGARFEPKGAITRAEAAAVIYRIATGDVNDTQKDIYTAWNGAGKLSDVSGWYAGYVNYCCNAGYIKGYPNGTFQAQNNVTGYEVLAMVLRAMGYGRNGEFSGSQWAITVGSLAQTLGITKNITETLGEPATREMVAEIVFRAIFCETQMYNALHLYEGTGTNLAANLNLEEVEGVVIANEYADLYDDDTLADGKTMVREGDKTYTINYGTTLDDLGESRMIYIQNKNTVISLADSGKNVKEETTAKEKLSAVLDRAGITQGDAESYVNFGQTLNWYSDWKISYEITIKVEEDETKAQAIEKARDTGFILPDFDEDIYGKDDAELIYREDFRKNTAIGNADQNNIEVIFDIADKKGDKYVDGEVYVGTTSKEDVSDKKSFNQFLDEYITEDDIANVSSNERGNWLKVIDNNADGQADYIFKVIYTFAQVSRIKDDTITLDVKNDNLLDEDGDACFDALNELTGEKVVPAEELVEDDVVYYAIIDGKAQTYKAATETATIDKINRNTRVVTASDGTEWTESEVCEHIEDENYRSDISELAGKVSYDLFFDRGGYLAAFIRSDLSNNFRLILDGWYNETKSGTEYAVKAYNAETGKVDTIDITTNGGLFIDGEVENDGKKVLNNDWGALKWLGGVNENSGALDNDPAAALNGDGMTAKTTIASISEDGTILPVHSQYVTGRNWHAMIAMIDNDIPTDKTDATYGNVYGTDVSGSGDDTAYNDGWLDDDDDLIDYEVVARADTVYYVVEGKSVVDVFTGYKNAPTSIDHVEDVYVVGTARNADNDLGRSGYFTADIVVIEVTEYDGDYEVVFVLDDETSHSDISRRNLRVIGEDGKEKNVDIWNGNYVLAVTESDSGRKIRPGVYKMYERSEDLYYLDWMTHEEIADARIIGGQVQYVDGTAPKDYVAINTVFNDGTTVTREGEKSYALADDFSLYHVSYNTGSRNGYNDTEPTVTTSDTYRDILQGRVERVRWTENGDTNHKNRLTDTNANSDYNGREGFRGVTTSGLYEDWAYFYNDVLIHYNSKGEVVWAVSFANVYGTPEKWDYAQEIWADNLCAGEAEAVNTIEFFGDSSLTADYTDAKAWMKTEGNVALDVTGVDYWLLTGPDGTTVKNGQPKLADAKEADAVYNLSFLDSKGDLQNYTLTLEEADHDSDLWYTGGKVSEADWVQVVPDEWNYTGINNTVTNIKEQFKLKTGSTAEEPKWTFHAADGSDIPNVVSVLPGYYAKVVVTSEDGYDRTYTIYFGTDNNFLQSAMSAIDKKAFDVYFNTANGKVTFYKTEEDAAANTGSSYIAEYTSDAITAASGDASGFNPGSFPEVAKAAATQLLEAQGVTSLNDNRLSVGLASAVEVDGTVGGAAATELYRPRDGAQTWITYTLGVSKADGSVINAGIVVRAHYVNTTTRTYGQAAKELVDGMTPQVYYSEWHAVTYDFSGGYHDPKYDKNGAAEYLSEDDAANLVKPDGTTIFDLTDTTQTSTQLGEAAAVATINKALKDAGNELHIILGAGRYGVANNSNWGPNKTAPTDVLAGDKYIRTGTYALVDDNNCDSGLTVTITWTLTAVVGAWNDGATYTDTVPAGYWA